MKKYKIVNQWNLLFVTLITSLLLIKAGLSVDRNDNLRHVFCMEYNERSFLLLYLNIHLVGLLPIFSKIFKEEQIVRSQSKVCFLRQRLKEIILQSVIYSLLLTLGWYFIVGIQLKNNVLLEALVIIGYYFIKVMIGMLAIGIFSMGVYIVIQNLVISYIVSYGILILLNFSLFGDTTSFLYQYMSVFRFMFTSDFQWELYREISKANFHIFLSILLYSLTYAGFKKHDFLKKGHEKGEDV